MPQMCSAPNCKNKGGHVFPKDPTRRKDWESALGKNFVASRYARLCAAHFKEEDYYGESIYTGYKPTAKFLRKTAIPSIFNFEKTKHETPLSRVRKQRLVKRSQKKHIQNKLQPSSSEDETQWDRIELEIDPLTLDDIPKPSTSQVKPLKRTYDSTLEIACNEIKHWIDTGTKQLSSKSTQIDQEYIFSSKSTQIDREYMFSSKSTQIDREYTFSSKSTQINREHMFGSIYRFEDDDKAILFYSGFDSYKKLQCAYASLHPLVHKIKYYGNNVLNLATENQFFLTLIKLRQNKCNFELSKFYNVSVTTVSNIFITWVNFIYQVWSEISNWPTELVECYMPVSFKKFDKRLFNSTSELLSYCSLVYKGSIISDGQEVELRKLMTKCQNVDSIHADGAFTDQDQDDMIIKDQELPNKGVHIKKIVGLTKTYNILKSDLDPRQVPIANKIFYICFMCCTFKESNKKENK